MSRDELLRALRRIGTPDKHRCLDCGYEHKCTIHGCAIIREAADRIERLEPENEALQEQLVRLVEKMERLRDVLPTEIGGRQT